MNSASPSEAKQISQLNWDSQFVDRFPGDPEKLNFTRAVKNILHSEVKPTPVAKPQLIGWSNELARDLGFAKPTAGDEASLEILAGNRVHENMRPYASRYGGHQFGNWAGQLGDGRAITLGEVQVGVERFEFQLKGAGPTPYSRRGDGRAVLRSSIREFLCSEAMHFLGIPTTRALSLVLTGDQVIRDVFYNGNEKPEPGAIVCRVSPTFLRFGNFEILASSEEHDLLKQLVDHAITEHYFELDLQDPDVYGKFLEEVATSTAHLMAQWMRVGFVHGVMNTDNMSILGLTIDYGPYGWLEPFDPKWTPNTTDAQGKRYAYGNQPSVALWNLARFAESLFPLIQSEDRIHAALDAYRKTFEQTYGSMLAQKLGFHSLEKDGDESLITQLFDLLQSHETDFTVFFRALSEGKVSFSPTEFFKLVESAFYSPEKITEPLKDRWLGWFEQYSIRLKADGGTDEARSVQMKQVNPKYVLRNYIAQNAITAAEKGDYSLIEKLLEVLKTPYADQPENEMFAAKRPEWARNAPGCSALSCSS